MTFQKLVPSLVLLALLGLVATPSATAHSSFKVGNNLNVKVGWLNEPPIVDQGNAIIVIVTDAQGKGVEGLASSLKVSVVYGADSKNLEMEAGETAGEYLGGILPTVEGVYHVKVTGNLQGTQANGDLAVEKVEGNGDLAFPQSYGTRAETASTIRLLEICAFAAIALAVIGIVMGILGFSAARRASKAANANTAAPARAPPAPGAPRPPAPPPPMRR